MDPLLWITGNVVKPASIVNPVTPIEIEEDLPNPPAFLNSPHENSPTGLLLSPIDVNHDTSEIALAHVLWGSLAYKNYWYSQQGK